MGYPALGSQGNTCQGLARACLARAPTLFPARLQAHSVSQVTPTSQKGHLPAPGPLISSSGLTSAHTLTQKQQFHGSSILLGIFFQLLFQLP